MDKEIRKARVFRMTDAEYEEIQEAARVAGFRNTSVYLRHTLGVFSRLILQDDFVIAAPRVMHASQKSQP